MTEDSICYEVCDSIATITFNCDDKLNAFTGSMMGLMMDLLDQIDADDNVRAAIIAGHGRAFCAGADISASTEGFSKLVATIRQSAPMDRSIIQARMRAMAAGC